MKKKKWLLLILGICSINFVSVINNKNDSQKNYFTTNNRVYASAGRDECWTSVVYQKDAIVLMCYQPCCYYEDHVNNNQTADGTCKQTNYPFCIPPQ